MSHRPEYTFEELKPFNDLSIVEEGDKVWSFIHQEWGTVTTKFECDVPYPIVIKIGSDYLPSTIDGKMWKNSLIPVFFTHSVSAVDYKNYEEKKFTFNHIHKF